MVDRAPGLHRLLVCAWWGAVLFAFAVSSIAAVLSWQIPRATDARLCAVPGASAYYVRSYLVLSPVSTAFPGRDGSYPLRGVYASTEDERLSLGLTSGTRRMVVEDGRAVHVYGPPVLRPGVAGARLIGWHGYPALLLDLAWLYAPLLVLCSVAALRGAWWLTRFRRFLLIATPIVLLVTVQSSFLAVRVGLRSGIHFGASSGLVVVWIDGTPPAAFVETDRVNSLTALPVLVHYWTAGMGVGIAPWLPVLLVAIYAGFRRWRRRRMPGCQDCGYDLTGNISGRCPECGRPIDRRVPEAIDEPPGAMRRS